MSWLFSGASLLRKLIRAAGLLYAKDTPPGFLSQYLPSRSVESSSIFNDQVGQDGRCPIGAVAFFICRHSNCRPQFERGKAERNRRHSESASALCAVAVRICPAAPRKKPAHTGWLLSWNCRALTRAALPQADGSDGADAGSKSRTANQRYPAASPLRHCQGR